MGIDIKRIMSRHLSQALAVHEEELYTIIEIPPERDLGDFAVPCFRFARNLKKNPAQIAKDFEQALTKTRHKGAGGSDTGALETRDVMIREVKAAGPYLNLFLDRGYLAKRIIEHLTESGLDEIREIGSGKTVVIDYSSPNIAKPFGIGHLRSTVIGNALKNIFSFLGYRTVGINHLGDWGTQFGKLIAAFKKWGSENELSADPIQHLFALYVRFHKEAEEEPALEDEARLWFSRLENGDGEARALWEHFRDLSLEAFKKIYDRLGVAFDDYTGESFYSPMLDETINEIVSRGIAVESEGALIVPMDEMTPALIKKSDDATLYLTRDIAAAIYRYKTFRFDLALYVVGAPQALHFKQLFYVLEKLGYDWALSCHHVPFGQIGFPDGAMSTRKGNIIFLEDVLDKARELALKIVREKNPDLKNKKEVAEAVGVGSIIFNDLKNSRIRDITFVWEDVLNFNGETGPYLQYTHARINSLLRNFRDVYGDAGYSPDLYFGEEGYAIALLLNDFEEAVLRASRDFEPSIISRYLLNLTSEFNSFYNAHRVVGEYREISLSRALLVTCVKKVLKQGLELLGIRAIEEM